MRTSWRAPRIVAAFPDDNHPPILYPIALTAAGHADAAKFPGFLESPAARCFFGKQGFTARP